MDIVEFLKNASDASYNDAVALGVKTARVDFCPSPLEVLFMMQDVEVKAGRKPTAAEWAAAGLVVGPGYCAK